MRILIAEDDLTSRTLLAGVVKKWGFEVVAVKDGAAAWEILQQTDGPQLAILDWMMPEMNGLEVIQRIRALFIEQQPYIILLTTKDEKSDIVRGLDTGANDYIIKPFDREELYARIRVGQRSVELQTSLYEAQQTLQHLASHDPLTGIFNRRAILDQLSKELSRARRGIHRYESNGVSIGFIDIDHFKLINDRYGHQVGDEVLKGIINILGGQIREYDTVGRLGGDEFLVVAVRTGEGNCEPLFDRLLDAIIHSKIMTGSGELSVSVSIGVASSDNDFRLDNLLDSADAAMYLAKREGGNRIVYAA